MLVKIVRGIGGTKGLTILILTVGIGLILIIVAFNTRHQMLTPKGVPATQLTPEQVVTLGDQARGPNPQVAFIAGDAARVVVYAAARHADSSWTGLTENAMLKVTGVLVTDGETWVTGEAPTGPVTVHASFLELYRPVVLDKLVELSDVRLSVVREGTSAGTSITGRLRNISSQTISQCVVTCVFQDRQERDVDVRRSGALTLPAGELVPFQTMRTTKPFGLISVQITHATPDGLRNYLSTVVIKKSNLE